MSEPSPILRALRPRTHKRSTQKQESETEASEEETDGGTNQMDTSAVNNLEEQKDEEDNVYNEDDDNNVDDDDDDDDDDDEPRLTIKEEPEENDDVTDDKTPPDNKYECKSCRPTAEFPSLVEYLKHLKDFHHQKAKYHECPHCNFICQHPKKLERHILVTHSEENNDITASEANNRNQCSMCSFMATDQSDMTNHQRLHHLKRRFFRCTKCSYMTHVRARYTKHVKYHSMPMIKCDDCDFRTPYKVGASDYRDVPEDSNSTKNTDGDPIENTEDPSSAIAGAECIALKCEEKGCQFITAWDSEMQRHLMECHAPLQSPNKSKKPIPMLIPLSPENNSNNTASNSSPPLLKVPRVRVRPELAKIARDTEIAKLYNNREQTTGVRKEVGAVKSFEKRNASFFDKLKERLITNTSASSSQVVVSTMEDLKCWCTFKANNSEELARHKKTHHTALSVSSHELSRCTKCRKPFSSLTDLQIHMQVCSTVNNDSMISTSRQENTGVNANYTAASHYGDFEFPFQVDWDANGGLNSSGSSIDGTANATTTRRVFKCPHCSFWASTASRFHVHIVGHLNRKPFECSLCAYRSNWRWDITKHIKLKAARDPAHANARVLMTDETGRRNYSKYNKYLAQMEQSVDDPNNDECGTLNSRTDEPPRKRVLFNNSKTLSIPEMASSSKIHKNSNQPGYGRVQDSAILSRPPPPLQATKSGQSLLKPNQSTNSNPTIPVNSLDSKTSVPISYLSEETKRTLWKCKRCNFRDANKDMVLLHVKSHYESLELSSNNEKNPFACKDCPFIAKDATSLAMHKVHHQPNLESIFKCYLCPYYVSTKAELLDHVQLHGEELAVVHQRATSDPASKKSRSPINSTAEDNSLNKVDISVDETSRAASILSDVPKTANGSTPPLLLDTRALPDTPLVWVSRPNGTFVKMLKCRHCPHVSSRRAEVRDHEMMHNPSTVNETLIACPDCSFSCSRKEVMDSHTDMHQGALGTVHCLVDDSRSDAQQLDDLTTLLGLTKTPIMGSDPDLRDPRLVHYCSKCPGRFLSERELQIHLGYHSAELPFACEWCSYTAKLPEHLVLHQKAHAAEYQDHSQQLLILYGHSQRYPPPRTACIETGSLISGSNKNVAWIVVEIPNFNSSSDQIVEHKSGNQVFTCAKCPARYFKLDALEYHMTLHGSNNRFKCSECDYSSKTAQNLMKHQVVHKRQNEMNESLAGRRQSFTNTSKTFTKNGKFKEKPFKCHKCPSSFNKREQYQVHLTMHGAKRRYRCDTCDFSVKYYANYVQHLKKHHSNNSDDVNNQSDISMEYDQDYNEIKSTNYGKSRRKSTISSGLSAGNNSSIIFGGLYNISNQDKQSILFMQKKEETIAMLEEQETLFRCHECPFSSPDKDILDIHKRRHGLERLTPPCPHCNYVPRKDENVSEHIKLHFTRLYKPESYLVIDLLTLMIRKISPSKKDDKKENELLFRECEDGQFLPVLNSNILPVNVTNGNNIESITVDPNTGETTHRFSM
ncbi:zinc finger protein 845-like isoform X2 [Chelonus insularis]|uniref:zinc finger protein 845-like isoform X2 n=1 Tax=Chelonus insularis TaxID=460826 RepID=UPI00158997DD|nr:zinc finger protein 845-like isoform X2 [Chelonus insularis]